MNVMQLLFSFEGRTRRLHWWLAGIGLVIAEWVLAAILNTMFMGGAAATMTPANLNSGGLATLMSGAMTVNLIVSLVFLWPSLALGVKRLHDRNKSGWWLALMWLACFTLIGILWPLIELGFLDGTPGPNRFGPSPKGIAGSEPAAAAT